MTLAALVARVPLQGVPHVTDELAYTLQSRLFAAGLRVGPPGDNPSMLLYPFWVTAPVSYSPFPPGWPALLGVGEALGLAWLVNPLLFGLAPALTWLLAREWTDAPTARLAALAMAVSPGAWVLAASRMSQTSVMVALLGALVVAQRRRVPPGISALAGLAVAYVVLARPFDALLFGGPLLAWSLWRRRGARHALGLVLPPALAAALVLWDNHHLTGSPWTFPMNRWYDGWVVDIARQGCNRLGFGADRGCYPTLGTWGHTPFKALRIAGATALRLDRLTLGLPGGGLLVLLGAWRLRRALPLVIAALVVGAYALYWSPGLAYGARFWHPLYVVLPVLLAVSLRAISPRWATTALLAAALLGGSFVARDLSDRYWCVDAGLRDQLDAAGVTEGVIFLEAHGARHTAWPALGVDDFVCDPMLEAGDGFLLMDPTHTRGGLQIRHALPDEADTRAWLRRAQPGARAWRVVQDVGADTRRVDAVR